MHPQPKPLKKFPALEIGRPGVFDSNAKFGALPYGAVFYINRQRVPYLKVSDAGISRCIRLEDGSVQDIEPHSRVRSVPATLKLEE